MFALRPGASGLQSHGEAMSVVGSNIANVNTTGYKSNRVNFQDLLATAVKGTDDKIGKGVSIANVQGDFQQGGLQSTSNVTDMAVEGDGFFTLRDENGAVTYTRAGNFQFDNDGFLVAANGKRVMTRQISPQTGQPEGQMTGAELIGLNIPPEPTGDGTQGSGVDISVNLNADAAVPEVQFDPTNVQKEMYNYQTSVRVIDNRGGEHTVNMVFRKMPDQPPQIDPETGQPIPGSGQRNAWQFYTVVNGSEVGAPNQNQIAIGGGFLRFDDQGRLLEATNGQFQLPAQEAQVGPEGQIIPPGPPQLAPAPLNEDAGVPQVVIPFTDTPQQIGLNFGQVFNPEDPDATGLDGTTGFASSFKTLQVNADGYAAGTLESVDVDTNGVISGFFDNGEVQPLYQLHMTRFANNQGLLRAGENEWTESLGSGQPIQGLANQGQFGSVRARNLEESNVDLSKEFVDMIETQRAFQANAKGITTSDEMLADLVAMKR